MDKKEQVLLKVTKIFRDVLEDETINLTYESSADTVEKWDSINNLLLISEIEGAFQVTFPLEVIFEARNVGDLTDYLVNNSAIF